MRFEPRSHRLADNDRQRQNCLVRVAGFQRCCNVRLSIGAGVGHTICVEVMSEATSLPMARVQESWSIQFKVPLVRNIFSGARHESIAFFQFSFINYIRTFFISFRCIYYLLRINTLYY